MANSIEAWILVLRMRPFPPKKFVWSWCSHEKISSADYHGVPIYYRLNFSIFKTILNIASLSIGSERADSAPASVEQ